jgi:hypothetical protein
MRDNSNEYKLNSEVFIICLVVVVFFTFTPNLVSSRVSMFARACNIPRPAPPTGLAFGLHCFSFSFSCPRVATFDYGQADR